MNKKGDIFSSQTSMWILFIITIVVLLMILYPNLMGKLSNTALSFGGWLVEDPKRPDITKNIPIEIESSYTNFFDQLEKAKQENRQCLMKYNGLSTEDDISIELYYENGFSGWIYKKTGKQGGFRLSTDTVAGLKPCILDAKNFYDEYLKEEKQNTGRKAVESDLIIEGDKIKFLDDSYSFDQDYLIKLDDEHICFILTHKVGNIFKSCDAKDYTLDNDCITDIKDKFEKCSSPLDNIDFFYTGVYYGKKSDWKIVDQGLPKGKNYFYQGNDPRVPYAFKEFGLSINDFENKVFNKLPDKMHDKKGMVYKGEYYGVKEDWEYKNGGWVYIGSENVPNYIREKGLNPQPKFNLFGPPKEG
ncbi:hypothetical protein GOV14_04720 [Candidatus Pacearchaeota archaeon]|nr:hypothetical protein [Candidatus Pacearchaeota archaeon]